MNGFTKQIMDWLGIIEGHTLTTLAAKLGDDPKTIKERFDAIVASGLGYRFTVTTATDTTHFKSTDLVGLGNTFFAGPTPWSVYMTYDAGAAGAAPQGEIRATVAFTSSDGTVEHSTFSAQTGVGDKGLMLHPAIARILNTTDGLSALKILIDTANTNLGAVGDAATAADLSDIATTSLQAKVRRALMYVKDIYDIVAHATYGLSALYNIMIYMRYTGDRLYFDSVGGSAGTAYPIGTVSSPSSNVANLQTICTATKIKSINISGVMTLGQAWAGYDFHGKNLGIITELLDISGQDVSASSVYNMLVTGAQGGAGSFTLRDAIAITISNYNGFMRNTSIYSTLGLKDTGYIGVTDCNAAYGAVTITVQAPTWFQAANMRGEFTLDAQDGGTAYFESMGRVNITNMTGGTLYLVMNGGALSIAASCTAGTIIISGHTGSLTNSTGGTTVTNNLLNTKVDTVLTAVQAVDTPARKQQAGVMQILTVNKTSNANAGDVTIATCNTQKCLIHKIIARSNGATTADLTSIEVFGATGKRQTYIDATQGAKANLAADGNPAASEVGGQLNSGETIVATYTGTGPTATDITYYIIYSAVADGGNLT